ncbi:MAG: YbaB/EbfC family nucleoid-associated protein [Tepidisphaerales bacterium]
MLKNLGDLPGLMRKAQEMQEKALALQEELARRQVSADAGAGMVTATVNGRLELVRLRIDKDRIDLSDTALLEDMVVAAVAAAQRKAAVMMQEELARMGSELGLPPGALPPGPGGPLGPR